MSLAGYERLLSILSSHEGQIGFSLSRTFSTYGATDTMARLGAVAVVSAVAAAGLVVWRLTDSEVVLFSATIIGSLLLCPIVWSHYLVIAFVPLLVSGVSRWWLLAYATATWWIATPPSIIRAARELSDWTPSKYRFIALQLMLLAILFLVCRQAIRRDRSNAVSQRTTDTISLTW
ncbi:MAG: hypothetical protein ACR2KJ_06120 [Jatrophihabitans sp.]